MARISLKSYASLIAAFKLNKSKVTADSEKAKLVALGDTLAAHYSDGEKYSNLIKIGPVVENAIDGVHSLEEQVAHLHEFVLGQLGEEADFNITKRP